MISKYIPRKIIGTGIASAARQFRLSMADEIKKELKRSGVGQNIARILLGLFLVFAGTGHLTFSRQEFGAQVPRWLPMNVDLVVILSGILEIALGASLVFLLRQRTSVGWVVAAFFVLVFPGNIAQLVNHRNAFGLDTDLKRWLRLPFQPMLIFLALWSTGAYQEWRVAIKRKRRGNIELV